MQVWVLVDKVSKINNPLNQDEQEEGYRRFYLTKEEAEKSMQSTFKGVNLQVVEYELQKLS